MMMMMIMMMINNNNNNNNHGDDNNNNNNNRLVGLFGHEFIIVFLLLYVNKNLCFHVEFIN